MAYIKKIVTLFALCAVLAVAVGQVSQGDPHASQGHPHQNQGRNRRQVDEDYQDENVNDETKQPINYAVDWTACNFTDTPRTSCYDCNTRLICKPIGGLLKYCFSPFKPHCNNGICTAEPSAECT